MCASVANRCSGRRRKWPISAETGRTSRRFASCSIWTTPCARPLLKRGITPLACRTQRSSNTCGRYESHVVKYVLQDEGIVKM